MIEYSRRASTFDLRSRAPYRKALNFIESIWVKDDPDWDSISPNGEVLLDGWRLMKYGTGSVYFSPFGTVRFRKHDGYQIIDVHEVRKRGPLSVVNKSVINGSMADQMMYEAMEKRFALIKKQPWDVRMRRVVKL